MFCGPRLPLRDRRLLIFIARDKVAGLELCLQLFLTLFLRTPLVFSATSSALLALAALFASIADMPTHRVASPIL